MVLFDRFPRRRCFSNSSNIIVKPPYKVVPIFYYLRKFNACKNTAIREYYCYYEKIGNAIKNISEEIPFDAPDNWEWIRVGNLFQHNTGKALNSSNTKGIKHKYITTSNLYWGYFKLDSLREMPFTEEEFEKCSIKKGDLLVCEGGDIGRSAIWDYDIPMCIQNHIHRLRPYENIEISFYYYVFFLYKHLGFIGGKGIGIQGLSSGALAKLLFPLPPIQEQKRIVCKIEEVFSKIKDEY